MTQPLIIQVSNLSQRVSVGKEQLTILDKIQLQVKSGESVAIVGASGSGKSTLLGMLAGLDMPTEGEIFIAGQPLHSMDEEQRAQLRSNKIGFVFQSFLLIPELTALENVMLPAELRGIRQARELAIILLKEVGLGERLQHKPAKLSGGEQQRVALARAFICQPTLLLADEPTGNLDQHTGQKIIDLLFRMNAETGSSLVIVTHDAALAARCQRQVKMHAGRLEEAQL
jgi:putative ABC transport system ATP-binding protein